MNLKSFHLLFISVSVVLAAFVAAWGLTNGSMLAACASVAGAIVLIVYGTAFQRKMRRL